MLADWSWDERDAERAAAIASHLPENLFDAHAHLYRLADLRTVSGYLAAGPAVGEWNAWQRSVGRLFGAGRATGGLFFAMPQAGLAVDAANAFLAAEVAAHPGSRGLLVITPHCRRADVEARLDRHPELVGFKPYHLFATSTPTFQAPLGDYLPAWAWEVANARGLVIMLHMVRDRALADPDNQREIVGHCRHYPRARLILAHAARGFHAPNTVNGLPALAGLENVWFDSSGICEATALTAILRYFGPRRLMWGTDFPVSELRGKCVTVGDGFCWINPTTVDDRYPGAPAVHTYPVGLESMQALLDAADACGLDERERHEVFGGTARRLLGLPLADSAPRT